MRNLFVSVINPDEKAFKINLDNSFYGSFAEIGAGQEVARHFFRVGAAAGTIAKTMSAYDMSMSDAIYGKESSGRYVSEERLSKMLDHEYKLLGDRLKGERFKDTKFFVFADTVAAKSYGSKKPGHGWLGVRFQHEKAAKPTTVHLHVQLYDNQNYLQQEALGRIGVNLIYACFYYLNEREKFISSLMDALSVERIEIDMIRVSGPGFEKEDSRLLNLELIKKNFSQAVIFDENGIVCRPGDVLYKNFPLVLRGSFRPPTFVNLDMIKVGEESLKQDLKKSEQENIVILPEISMAKLLERGDVENEDFLARVDLLSALGQKVMISNKESFHDLNSYLMNLTSKTISFVAGVYNLESIFHPNTYKKHTHGEMMAIGELFTRRTNMYVYPGQDEKSKEVLTAEKIKLPERFKRLLDNLIEHGQLKDLTSYNPEYFTIWSREVVKMIQDRKSGWEKMVPDSVAKTVKSKKLFTS